MPEADWFAALAERLQPPKGWSVAYGPGPMGPVGWFNVSTHVVTTCALECGLQLRGTRLRVFCQPDPYGQEASEEQFEAVVKLLLALKEPMGAGGNIYNSENPGLGHRSLEVYRFPDGPRSLEEWAKKISALAEKMAEVLVSSTEVRLTGT